MRTEQHLIDDDAESIFRMLKPREWVLRELSRPDYLHDYLMEIFDQGKPTGFLTLIQLKGTRLLKVTKGRVAFALPMEKAQEYVKYPVPVFLTVIDVRGREGYWLFLQEHLRDEIGDVRRTRKSITVHVPLDNKLSNHAALAAAVRRAYDFLAELNPGSVAAAIAAEIAALEALDRRFKASITSTEAEKIVALSARDQPVSVKATFIETERRATMRKLEELLRRGISTAFERDEITFSGSPLIEHIADVSPGPVIIRPLPLGYAEISLSAVDSDEQEIARLSTFAAEVSGGQEEMRITGSLTPILTVQVTARSDVVTRLSLTLNIESGWIGRPVLELAHFDEILGFFRALNQGCLLKLRLSRRGNVILSTINRRREEYAAAAKLYPALDIIDTARDIARRLGLNPAFSRLSWDDAAGIASLHKLLKGEEVRESVPNFRASFSLEREGIAKLLKTTQERKDSTLGLVGLETFSFMRQQVELKVRRELTHSRVVSRASLERYMAGHSAGPARVTLGGSEDSELVVRLVDSSSEA